MESLGYPTERGTINEGSFNVPDDRASEINDHLSQMTRDHLDDAPNWDDFYHRHMKPIAQNENEQLFIAFSYGKLVNALEMIHKGFDIGI